MRPKCVNFKNEWALNVDREDVYERIVTACQRSCGKVMFSVVAVRHSVGGRGSHVAIAHDALDLIVQICTPHFQTWDLTVQGTPYPLQTKEGLCMVIQQIKICEWPSPWHT